MITKLELINYLGGSNSSAAKELGYTGYRADNNVSRLPYVLTDRQLGVIIMRMRSRRIKVPTEWLSLGKE